MHLLFRFLAVLALVCNFSSRAAETKIFRAGAAAANISPWMGISINGNMHDHKGTNLHDQLHARCLVLDDGTNRIAFVVTDSCLIYREIFDAAKKIVHEKIGLPVDHILMSATHTHSAPASVSIFQSDADKEYQHFLTLRLADAVLQAVNNLRPAKIAWASADEPRHVSNRRWFMQAGVTNKNMLTGVNDAVKMNPRPGNPDLREPAGPTDPQVSVVMVKGVDGKPIGLLGNYSMHYVGDVGGDSIYSADYYGAFCERVKELLGADHQDPPFVALMSNGTSGDCSSTDFRHAVTNEPAFTKINRAANDIAEVALGAIKNAEWHDWVELKSAQKEIMVGVRKPTAEEVVKAKEKLAKAVKHNGQFGGWSPEVYERETVLLNEFPDQVPLILQTYRIGDLAIAAVPCEVFAEIGLAIKKESPFKPSFTIELANGYNGYLPTPAQHKLGGYETWRARSSYLEVEAAPKIFVALMGMFDLLR